MGLPRDRFAFELLAIEAGEKVDQAVTGNGFKREFVFAGELVKLHEVAAISGDGVGREAFLHAHMSQEGRDGGGYFH
jgi:hypothetical protein